VHQFSSRGAKIAISANQTACPLWRVIRAAPTPFYNRFHEVWRFAKILAENQ